MDNEESKNTDISSIVRGELEALKYQVNVASKRAINRIASERQVARCAVPMQWICALGYSKVAEAQ